MKANRRFSASVESCEGRALQSATAMRLAPPAQHGVPITAVSSQTTVKQYGTASAAAGGTAQVTILLGVVGRTGIITPLNGTVKVYSGSTLVGSVNVGGVFAPGGPDVYGRGIFSFVVPKGSAHGSSILLTLKYDGAQLYSPSTGSASVMVK